MDDVEDQLNELMQEDEVEDEIKRMAEMDIGTDVIQEKEKKVPQKPKPAVVATQEEEDELEAMMAL